MNIGGGNPQRFVGENESKSQRITCPICGRPTMTRVEKKPNFPLFILVILFFPLLIFIWIDVKCMRWIWRYEHFCSAHHCKRQVNKLKMTKVSGMNGIRNTQL